LSRVLNSAEILYYLSFNSYLTKEDKLRFDNVVELKGRKVVDVKIIKELQRETDKIKTGYASKVIDGKRIKTRFLLWNETERKKRIEL